MVLYYHEESEIPGQEQRLRIEFRGPPGLIEKLVEVIREEMKKWEYWRET